MVKDLSWIPFATLFRREIARFMKVIVQTVITPFVSAALYLMIFGVSLGSRISFSEDLPYLAFLIPGLVMMGCLNNAFQNSSSSIISSKFSGDLEDLKVAPFTSGQIILALALAALVRGLIVGAITLLVSEISYYSVFGELLPIAHPFYFFLFLFLGGVTFAYLGISVGFYSRSFDQLSAISGFILMPLIYLGGVFFSVEHLPGFWRNISLVNPLLYLINGVRYGIIGRADVAVETSLTVAIVAFVLTGLLALASLSRGSFHRW